MNGRRTKKCGHSFKSCRISQFKQYLEIEEEGKIILEPGVVTETRTRQLQNQSILEYLIKWKNLPAEDSTWEDKDFIQKHQELLKC